LSEMIFKTKHEQMVHVLFYTTTFSYEKKRFLKDCLCYVDSIGV